MATENRISLDVKKKSERKKKFRLRFSLTARLIYKQKHCSTNCCCRRRLMTF